MVTKKTQTTVPPTADEVPAEVLEAVEVAEHQLPLLATERTQAVDEVYEGVPADVVAKCEDVCRGMRGAFVIGLRTVRDLLAPYGKFKAWCVAKGLNYGTVKNQLSQAESKETGNESLSGSLPDTDTGTKKREAGTNAQKPKAAQLIVPLKDDEDKAALTARLRDELTALGVTTDDWGQAIWSLVNFKLAHTTPVAQDAPTAIAQEQDVPTPVVEKPAA